MRLLRFLPCMLMLHSPDGEPLFIDSEAIVVVKPINAKTTDHLAKGTRAVVYAGQRPNGFGVMELADDISSVLRRCSKQMSPAPPQ